MFNALAQLEQLIRPLETAEYLGFQVRQKGDHFTTTCPYCEGELWIQSSSYLCENTSCPMLAGSVVEIAAAKTRSYQDGANLLFSHFKARILQCPEFTPENFAPTVTYQARLRRKLSQQIRAFQTSVHVTGQRALVLSELQKQGMHDPGQHLIGIMLEQERVPFLELLERLGLPEPILPPNVPLLVIPYWHQPHALAAIVLMHPRSSWRTTIEIESFGVAIAGLRMLSPSVHSVWLHDTALAAGVQNAQWRIRDPQTVSVACLLGTETCAVPELPGVVAHFGPQTSTTMIARLQRIWQDLMVANHEETPKPFDTFLFELLRTHIRKSSFTSRGLILLGSFNPQGGVRQRLHARLKNGGFVGAADQLARTLYSLEIARTDKTTILETPDGYAIRRAGGPQELFSNFIIRLDQNVTFGEKAALHHRATVMIGDVEQKFIMPGRLLDAPRDLQEHIQLQLAAEKSLLVPALRDPSAFKHVSYYLKGTLPRLPTQVGLPFLGWNFKRDCFFTPGAILGMEGLIRGCFPLHPDIFTLDAFDPAEMPEAHLDLDLPREIQTYLLLILGSIIRGHRGERLQAIQVRHEGPAVSLLSGIFRGLGQVRPVIRVERNAEGLHQYPAWATAGRDNHAINAPYFLLSSHGRPVVGDYSEDLLAKAASTLRVLVRRSVETLLGFADDVKWRRQPSVLYSNGLTASAQEFLSEHCGIQMEADMTSFEWTEKLLQQIPTADLGETFTYDFANQRVFCNVERHRDSMDLAGLEQELRSLADTVTVRAGHQIEMDAFSAFKLLETYYGAPPHLPAAV